MIICQMIVLLTALSLSSGSPEKLVSRHARATMMIDMRGFPDTPPYICRGAGFQRNTTDCTQFYRCVDFNNNGKHTIFRFMCGPMAVFDESRSLCTGPELAVPACPQDQLDAFFVSMKPMDPQSPAPPAPPSTARPTVPTSTTTPVPATTVPVTSVPVTTVPAITVPVTIPTVIQTSPTTSEAPTQPVAEITTQSTTAQPTTSSTVPAATETVPPPPPPPTTASTTTPPIEIPDPTTTTTVVSTQPVTSPTTQQVTASSSPPTPSPTSPSTTPPSTPLPSIEAIEEERIQGFIITTDNQLIQNQIIANINIVSQTTLAILSRGDGSRIKLNEDNGSGTVFSIIPAGALLLIQTTQNGGVINNVANGLYTTSSTTSSFPPGTTFSIVKLGANGQIVSSQTLLTTKSNCVLTVPENSFLGTIEFVNRRVVTISGWSFTTTYVTTGSTSSSFGVLQPPTTATTITTGSQSAITTTSTSITSDGQFISGIVTLGGTGDSPGQQSVGDLTVAGGDLLAIIPQGGQGVITLIGEGSINSTDFTLTPGSILAVLGPSDGVGVVTNVIRPMYTSPTTTITFPAGTTISIMKIGTNGQLVRISFVQVTIGFTLFTSVQSLVGVVQTNSQGIVSQIGTGAFTIQPLDGTTRTVYLGVLNLNSIGSSNQVQSLTGILQIGDSNLLSSQVTSVQSIQILPNTISAIVLKGQMIVTEQSETSTSTTTVSIPSGGIIGIYTQSTGGTISDVANNFFTTNSTSLIFPAGVRYGIVNIRPDGTVELQNPIDTQRPTTISVPVGSVFGPLRQSSQGVVTGIGAASFTTQYLLMSDSTGPDVPATLGQFGVVYFSEQFQLSQSMVISSAIIQQRQTISAIIQIGVKDRLNSIDALAIPNGSSFVIIPSTGQGIVTVNQVGGSRWSSTVLPGQVFVVSNVQSARVTDIDNGIFTTNSTTISFGPGTTYAIVTINLQGQIVRLDSNTAQEEITVSVVTGSTVGIVQQLNDNTITSIGNHPFAVRPINVIDLPGVTNSAVGIIDIGNSIQTAPPTTSTPVEISATPETTPVTTPVTLSTESPITTQAPIQVPVTVPGVASSSEAATEPVTTPSLTTPATPEPTTTPVLVTTLVPASPEPTTTLEVVTTTTSTTTELITTTSTTPEPVTTTSIAPEPTTTPESVTSTTMSTTEPATAPEPVTTTSAAPEPMSPPELVTSTPSPTTEAVATPETIVTSTTTPQPETMPTVSSTPTPETTTQVVISSPAPQIDSVTTATPVVTTSQPDEPLDQQVQGFLTIGSDDLVQGGQQKTVNVPSGSTIGVVSQGSGSSITITDGTIESTFTVPPGAVLMIDTTQDGGVISNAINGLYTTSSTTASFPRGTTFSVVKLGSNGQIINSQTILTTSSNCVVNLPNQSFFGLVQQFNRKVISIGGWTFTTTYVTTGSTTSSYGILTSPITSTNSQTVITTTSTTITGDQQFISGIITVGGSSDSTQSAQDLIVPNRNLLAVLPPGGRGTITLIQGGSTTNYNITPGSLIGIEAVGGDGSVTNVNLPSMTTSTASTITFPAGSIVSVYRIGIDGKLISISSIQTTSTVTIVTDFNSVVGLVQTTSAAVLTNVGTGSFSTQSVSGAASIYYGILNFNSVVQTSQVETLSGILQIGSAAFLNGQKQVTITIPADTTSAIAATGTVIVTETDGTTTKQTTVNLPTGGLVGMVTSTTGGQITSVINGYFTSNQTQITFQSGVTIGILVIQLDGSVSLQNSVTTRSPTTIVVPTGSVYGVVKLSAGNVLTGIGSASFNTQQLLLSDSNGPSNPALLANFGVLHFNEEFQLAQSTVVSSSNIPAVFIDNNATSSQIISSIILLGLRNQYTSVSSLSIPTNSLLAIIPATGQGDVSVSDGSSVLNFTILPGQLFVLSAIQGAVVTNIGDGFFSTSTTTMSFNAGTTYDVRKIASDGSMISVFSQTARSSLSISVQSGSTVGIIQLGSLLSRIDSIGGASFVIRTLSGSSSSGSVGLLDIGGFLSRPATTTVAPVVSTTSVMPTTPQPPTSTFAIDCALNELHQFPLDCSRFYQCFGDDVSGTTVYIFPCAPGLIFDDASSQCLTSTEATCDDSASVNETADTSQGVGGFFQINCSGDLYRYPLNCNNFYQCFKNEQGKETIFIFSCSAGLVFDEASRRCLLPTETASCATNENLFRAPSLLFQLRQKIDIDSLTTSTRTLQRQRLTVKSSSSQVATFSLPHQTVRGSTKRKMGYDYGSDSDREAGQRGIVESTKTQGKFRQRLFDSGNFGARIAPRSKNLFGLNRQE